MFICLAATMSIVENIVGYIYTYTYNLEAFGLNMPCQAFIQTPAAAFTMEQKLSSVKTLSSAKVSITHPELTTPLSEELLLTTLQLLSPYLQKMNLQ